LSGAIHQAWLPEVCHSTPSLARGAGFFSSRVSWKVFHLFRCGKRAHKAISLPALSNMSRSIIPVGRWKVETEPTDESQLAIRLSGRAFSDASSFDQQLHQVRLTTDQAQELISALNVALLELELRRTADLARIVDGEGAASDYDYKWQGGR
jgi:hypothetical protein